LHGLSALLAKQYLLGACPHHKARGFTNPKCRSVPKKRLHQHRVRKDVEIEESEHSKANTLTGNEKEGFPLGGKENEERGT